MKTATLFVLLFCLFFAACGPTTPPGTLQPTPTSDPNQQEVQLQAAENIKPSIFDPLTPIADQGINLPEISVRGLCNFSPPTPILVSTDPPPRVVVPVGRVLLLKRRSTSEEIEETNPTPGGIPNFFSLFIVIAAPGPTTVAENTVPGLGAGDEYSVVSTSQAGDMVAALVTEKQPLHCAPLADTDKFDSSLVDLSKSYSFPARFRVCASSCNN